jgi:hypothetical protein
MYLTRGIVRSGWLSRTRFEKCRICVLLPSCRYAFNRLQMSEKGVVGEKEAEEDI